MYRLLIAAARSGAALLLLTSVGSVEAQPPDTLTQYHLAPRLSVLTVSGASSVFEQRYRLEGQYDFLEEWQSSATSLQLSARFDNADVIAPLGEMLPAFIDVDSLLNLEGLRGELLPLGAPFDVYRFTGLASDSAAASPLEQSSVELYAAQLGRWMYLYGETTPPSHDPDRPVYGVKAAAFVSPWADMNGDGSVDAADYTLARDGDPAMVADYVAQYGEVVPDFAAVEAVMASALGVAIPEPATVLLAVIAVTPALGSRRCGCRP